MEILDKIDRVLTVLSAFVDRQEDLPGYAKDGCEQVGVIASDFCAALGHYKDVGSTQALDASNVLQEAASKCAGDIDSVIHQYRVCTIAFLWLASSSLAQALGQSHAGSQGQRVGRPGRQPSTTGFPFTGGYGDTVRVFQVSSAYPVLLWTRSDVGQAASRSQARGAHRCHHHGRWRCGQNSGGSQVR